MNFDGFKTYLLARAQEASTWRGVVLVLTATGFHWSPEYQEAVITVGLLVAGSLGALFPDKK